MQNRLHTLLSTQQFFFYLERSSLASKKAAVIREVFGEESKNAKRNSPTAALVGQFSKQNIYFLFFRHPK